MILKYLKSFFKNIQLNHILALIGFLLFLTFVWLRFIRKRLPKDIPFTLSILGLLLLIYICCIYGYIVVSLIRKSSKENIIIKQIIEILYKPLVVFDQSWKNISYIQPHYYNMIRYIVTNFQYIFKYHYFYIVFAIFPRIILLLVLYVDIFYFHKLYYIYRILFLSIFLFLNRYIVYSLKMWKDNSIVLLKLDISSLTVKYRRDVMSFPMEKAIADGTYDPNDPDWDLEDEIPPTFAISLKNYIEIETKSIINDNENLWYIVNTTDKSDNLYYKDKIFNKEAFNKLLDKLKNTLKSVIQSNIIVEYYNISKNMQEFINIRILIFLCYLLCWLYILILSLPSLNHIDLLLVLINGLKAIEEPFTGELLITMKPFYIK